MTTFELTTYDGLKRTILSLIDVPEEDFDPKGDLIDFGLDSIKVFDLITRWQAHGVDVDFALLGEEPTLDGWWRVIEPRLGARS